MRPMCFSGLLAILLPAIAGHAASHVAAPPQSARAITPAERYALPALQKRAGGATASLLASVRAMPAALVANDGVASPNFGGFVSAPFYPARLAASCTVDPFNCGVAVELTADFNNDGKPDVAVLQNDGTLNILAGDGNGGFSAPAAYSNPNASSTLIQQAFAVDVNKDGYVDIVAFDNGLNAILVYLNQHGTFSTPTAIDMNNGSVGGLAVGDVNGDGVPDVLSIGASSTSRQSASVTLQTYLGNGDGTFANPSAALTQSVTVPAQIQFPGNFAIALGDLNKDGKQDIAVVLEERTSQTTGTMVVTTALGNGDGSFGALNATVPVSTAISASATGFSEATAGVQIADLNGDGNPDVALDLYGSSMAAVLAVAPGNGSGGFGPVVTTPNFSQAEQIVYTDLNGDGIPDLIQSTYDPQYIQAWIGKGDGTFATGSAPTYSEDSGGSQGLALADFNGDGVPDLANMGSDYKQVSVMAGEGNGFFYAAPYLVSSTDAPATPRDLDLQVVEDVQGKGFGSAVFVDQALTAPQVVTALGKGDGTFQYVVGLPASAVPALGFVEPVSADFNGDGRQDLLLSNTDGTMAVALSNGDGTFATPRPLALPTLGCELAYAAAADLNGDGHQDIAVAYYGDAACGGSGGVASGYFVALGNGDGTFAAPVFTAYGSQLYSITIADMNLDGIPDLLVNDAPFQVAGNFAVDLLPGNGDGTFSAGTAIETGQMVSQVLAGDYAGSGKPGLVLLSEGEQSDGDRYSTAGILVLPGNGDGTFAAPTQIASGNFFLNGALADVNGDGKLDIVAALAQTVGQPNTYFGLMTLLGEGGGQFAAPVNTLEGLDSVLPLPGNFRNDSAVDVMVQGPYGPLLFLGQGGTHFALTPSAAALNVGAAETLTATVAAALPNRPAPAGTVSFYDGATLLGASPVAGGNASFVTAGLAAGAHSLTAMYSGDANFNPATSSPNVVTVASVAPAFTLTAAPLQGQTGAATLTLGANATFSDGVNLACAGLPATATCAINPGSVTLAPGGTAIATLVVTHTVASAALASPASPVPVSQAPAGIAKLAALVGLFAGWRSRRRLLATLSLSLVCLAGVGLSMSLVGCSGGSSAPSTITSTPTPTASSTPTTYNITVIATPASGSGASQSASVQVTVN